MKRITYLAAIAVALLAWAAPAQAAAESFMGSVKAVSASSITIERGTITGVFAVNTSTHLTVTGATAKTKEAKAAGKAGLTVPDAVHVGDWVIVRYVDQGKGMLASDIRVVTPLPGK